MLICLVENESACSFIQLNLKVVNLVNDKSSLISPQNVAECNERQDKITIQGTAKCYDKIFNNEIEIDEKNVLLTVHSKKAGTIIILGTSAIPEFPLFMPLAIGVLMVVILLQVIQVCSVLRSKQRSRLTVWACLQKVEPTLQSSILIQRRAS